MIYDFSGVKKQDDELEHRLQLLKKGYNSRKMSEDQVKNLKLKIEEEKMGYGKKKTRVVKFTAAAALIAGFIMLPNMSATAAHAMGQIPVIGHLVEAVTFRDYKYESDKNIADVKIPEIKINEQTGDGEADEKLQRATEEINAEILEITDKLVKEFKENLDGEDGYQDIVVGSEVLTSTNDYFTLKLSCYQAAGSGYENNYYYTIDLNTGERLQLKDLFLDGADYITLISKNIKEQMHEQMAADENIVYWIDSDMEEWNFKKIKKDAPFYLDEKGCIVISFNEGDVAPMYMGTVEFEIPEDVVSGIRK